MNAARPPRSANGAPSGAANDERGQGRAYGCLPNTASWARACPRSGVLTSNTVARGAAQRRQPQAWGRII